MKRILILGKNGQVGWELQRTLLPLGEVFAADRAQVDLTNPDTICSVIRDVKPQLIVNAAAYTAVDKAETEPDLAMAINGVAPGVMAEEAKRLDALLVHYSTDYVFDGTKQGAYCEDDAPNPLSVYGRSKLAGERAIAAVGGNYLILRTSWVYGARGRNFLLTMLRLGKERQELKIVDDQIGAPTWSRFIAEATAIAVARGSSSLAVHPASPTVAPGVYHLTAGGSTSWFGFAGAVFDAAVNNRNAAAPTLTPISTQEYPLPARRPANSRLNTEKLQKTLGIVCAPWQDALRLCVDDVRGG